MYVLVLLAVLCPFVLAVITTYVVRRWALRRGYVDRPAGHKGHGSPVALGGGIALFVSICGTILAGTVVAWLVQGGGPLPDGRGSVGSELALPDGRGSVGSELALPDGGGSVGSELALPDGGGSVGSELALLDALGSGESAPTWVPELVRVHLSGISSKLPSVLAILGCALVLHIVGLIDDRRPLGPLPKLVAQLAVAIFIAGPMGIRAVEALPAWLSIAVTVVWIVLITNAFNFLDNMDGLSAGVAAIAAAIFALASMAAGQVFVPIMAWVVVGGLLGFLLFNFSPASVFMGDAGSLVVGFLMSLLPILTTFYDPAMHLTPLGVIVPLVVLAVPLYDVVSVVTHRIRLGESPFRGDRRHFSHRLVKRGLTPRGAVLTIYLATAATGLPAIVLPRVEWIFAVLLLAQCLCVVVMIAILEHTGPPSDRCDTNRS